MKSILLLFMAILILPLSAMEIHKEEQFFQAAQKGDLATVKDAIMQSKIRHKNMQDEEGNTALMIAVKNDHIQLVKELLYLGADINIQNKEGKNALLLAIEAENSDMVKTLLHNSLMRINLSNQDKKNNTPLLLAVKKGNLTIIDDILLEAPNVSQAIQIVKKQKDSELKKNLLIKLESAQSPFGLFVAIVNKNLDDIKNYIPDSVSLDGISKITNLYRNPLALAIRSDEIDIVKLLISLGVNVNQALNLGITPLMIAVEENNMPIVKLLLENGAKPNAVRFDGKTPLFLAYDNFDMMKFLIQHGADVNYQGPHNIQVFSNINMTQLMLGAYYADFNRVKDLLDLGADPLIKNSEGKTARDLAQEQLKWFSDSEDYKKIVSLLEAKEKEMSKKIQTISIDQSLIHLLQNFTQKLYAVQNVLLLK